MGSFGSEKQMDLDKKGFSWAKIGWTVQMATDG